MRGIESEGGDASVAEHRRRRILVVDDDKMFCRVVRTYLEEVGFLTSGANAAAQVRAKVRQGCDLVVLDLYMTKETGIDVLIALRDEFPRLPVIIMTGYASNELRQTTENLGACDFLKKPFAMSALKEKIDVLLGDPS